MSNRQAALAVAHARHHSRGIIMAIQRFAVEWDRRTVGIAVKLEGGFVFYASDNDFAEMDGRTYARARALERHLNRIGKRRKKQRQRPTAFQAFA